MASPPQFSSSDYAPESSVILFRDRSVITSPVNNTGDNDASWDEITLLAIKGIFLTVVIILIMAGNFLVVVAVFTNNRLRSNQTCYFIVSLALADFFIGIIVLPVNMVTVVFFDNKWMFGSVACNLLICFDVTLCTASILNLFLTTCERYIAIVSPLQYPRYANRKSVLSAIGVVWLISAFCSFLPLHLGWNTIDGQVQNRRPTDDPHACVFEFNKSYNTTISVTTFFIPLVLLAFANVRILKIARSQHQTIAKQRNECHTESHLTARMARTSRFMSGNGLGRMSQSHHHVGRTEVPLLMRQNGETPAFQVQHMPLSAYSSRSNSIRITGSEREEQSQEDLENKLSNFKRTEFNSNYLPPKQSIARNFSLSVSNMKLSDNFLQANHSVLSLSSAIKHFTNENKATITILTVVGFFVLCWLPYFIMFTAKPFINPESWNEFSRKYPNFEPALVWLGYINSLCNPIIYTCLNRRYRMAFAKLLRLNGRKVRSQHSDYASASMPMASNGSN